MNADPIARWYRLFEYARFGSGLHERRCQYLERLAECRRALLLGDGDGRFCQALARAYPELAIDYVEASGAMLRLARTRIRGKVTFHRADARTFTPPHSSYDLVVTHFFLDCLTQAECEDLIARMAHHTSADAIWLVSEFTEPQGTVRRWWARLWIFACYQFFAFFTGLSVRRVPDYRPALVASGFRLEHCTSNRTGMLISELYRKRSSMH